MMRRFGCRDPKSTHMTLTLANRFIMYPYGILEDELGKVDSLTLPSDFVILYMPKDTKILLIHGNNNSFDLCGVMRVIIEVQQRTSGIQCV